MKFKWKGIKTVLKSDTDFSMNLKIVCESFVRFSGWAVSTFSSWALISFFTFGTVSDIGWDWPSLLTAREQM